MRAVVALALLGVTGLAAMVSGTAIWAGYALRRIDCVLALYDGYGEALDLDEGAHAGAPSSIAGGGKKA